MTAPNLGTRMTIGFDNALVLSRVTSITFVNIGTDSGSSFNNLLFEDPSLQWLSTLPTGEPEIIFLINQQTDLKAELVGVFNWTGFHEWDAIEFYWGVTTTGPWFELVTIDLNPSITEPGGDSKSFMFRTGPDLGGPSVFRFVFKRTATPRPRLRIGNLCIFRTLEVSMNPDTGGIRQSRIRTQRGRRALGGALHVARSVQVPTASAQFSWSRMDDVMLNQLHYIDSEHGDKFVGIIPPNQIGRELPLGLDHFLGRSLNLDATAKHGASPTTHASRVTWTLEGAI